LNSDKNNEGFVSKIRKWNVWIRILVTIVLILFWIFLANILLSGSTDSVKGATDFQGMWILTPIILGIVLTIFFGKSK
jgi:peptidoglycan biosynthesis protein MviN/MurJ (putative lipid II flippase)